ncbi:DNA-binding transcriptional regulator, XRE-family HTH domain [Natronincola peptidivorans]|uniref:DNA-binding transcriptional regulator, XRE-family HTH domain n=1 Tax=Natronincola peptidivorans TaxID=426128 RepID=A0A1I0EPI7_9FIRM|nr:helix-turn-helix transcriptional regulator [Natronincola peptidivorans]SET46497.1 DNA-binding transcriptional regulator, XRE-family HTH domain [Natronincola peptidivorans]
MENKIKAFIQEKGIKISYVLSETGLSKSYFYDVMKGKTIPSLVNARKIAKGIGEPLEEVFPQNQYPIEK